MWCRLYIVRFLHQTTTIGRKGISHHRLYIVRFLHQTTTHHWYASINTCCISSVSYIKPQPSRCYRRYWICCISYVSYIKPQRVWKTYSSSTVVYRPFPTSNHNRTEDVSWREGVVYRPFPTSNHNHYPGGNCKVRLYIVRFLHQTTTILEYL